MYYSLYNIFIISLSTPPSSMFKGQVFSTFIFPSIYLRWVTMAKAMWKCILFNTLCPPKYTYFIQLSTIDQLWVSCFILNGQDQQLVYKNSMSLKFFRILFRLTWNTHEFSLGSIIISYPRYPNIHSYRRCMVHIITFMCDVLFF